MAEFRIGVSVASLLPPGGTLTRAAFPTLSAVVRELTEAAHRKWVDYARGAPLPDGRSLRVRTGEYAQSITIRQTNDLTGEVFTDLAYADQVEEGTPARDLHDMLASSLKVRLSKTGKRYLIIPFRHYKPNSVIGDSMPEAIHGWWKDPARKSSAITGTYRRVSGTGTFDIKTRAPLTVPGWKYGWGTKLTKGEMRQMRMSESAIRRYAGMYRFDKPPEGKKAGGGHQQFITFRTLMEGSPGWRVPAKPGYHIAKIVAEQIRPIAEVSIREAVEADVRAMLGAR